MHATTHVRNYERASSYEAQLHHKCKKEYAKQYILKQTYNTHRTTTNNRIKDIRNNKHKIFFT